jgi:hypothetical protein
MVVKVEVIQGRSCDGFLRKSCMVRDVVLCSALDEPLDLAQIGVKCVALRREGTQHGVMECRETVDKRSLIDFVREPLRRNGSGKALEP